MASHSFLATSVVVFVVFCGTTDGAVTHSERSCNELDVLTCLEKNAKSIISGGGANDTLAVFEKVCGGNVKTCTQIQPLNKCPEEYRTHILALENSLQKAADALCQKDGALFIDVIMTLSCWRFEYLESCVEAINITSQLDLLTHKRRQQDWDHFNIELSKCIEGTREDTEDCKAADFGPVKKVIDIFFTQSPPPNNGNGAVTHSECSCNELDVLTCLEKNAESIIYGGGAIDIPAVIEKVCGGDVKTCTEIQPLNKCPEEYRTRILALENSLQKAADALCKKDGDLFIEVIVALSCVRLEDLVSCVEAINITSQLDLLTHKRRQQDWDHFNTELSKCIEGTREDTEDCKAADFGPVKKVIDIFFTQSPPPNNGNGAVTHSERSCNELDVLTCLEKNAESIIYGGGAIDIPAVIEKVCGGNVKTCTQIQPLNKCPEEYRTRILALENSLQKAADALCQKDLALFIEVIAALSCVRLEDLVSCVEAINITSQLDLLTHKRRQQDWDHFNTELSKCIEGTRERTEDCKAADFGPVKKVIDIFFTQSPPPNNEVE